MRELAEITGKDEGDAPEQGGRAGSLSIWLCLLAALNLAVMMIVTQLLSAPGLEHAQHTQQRGPVYLVQESGTGYAFQSCAGGESVNCHSDGNIVGL